MARALELESLDDECVIEARPTLIAGLLAFYTGDLERARTLLYPLRARLLERGEDTDLSLLSINLGWLECVAGDFEAARALSAEALRCAELGGAMIAHALAFASLLDAHEGNEAECRAEAAAAIAAMGEIEFCLVIQWTSAALSLLELSLGNAAAARDAAQPLTDFFGDREVVEPAHLLTFPDGIEALIELGEHERAAQLTELLATSGRAFDRAWAIASSARCEALLLAARGDIEGGRVAVERAIGELERLPLPFDLARTLIIKGQIERRAKRRAVAKDSLERAVEICDEIGATIWAKRARGELSRLGGRRDPDELTATEERVAALAASGLTNREIAAAAFMSPKTVEANLSRIYRKLGIRSRAELGLRLAERERAALA
jgi:DNA-binding CsgD family transcriptional regulator